jgi:HlyD family secretion protein
MPYALNNITMNRGCLVSLIIFVVIVLIGAGATLYYLKAKEDVGLATYNTESPTVDNIVLKTVATGSVQPRKEVQIKPQISGIVNEIYLEAGDTIKEGDLIARVKVIPDMVSMSNAENRLERARISRDNAAMDFERNLELFEKGVISRADFQQFEIAKRQAGEEMNAAEDNLAIIREGVAKRSGSGTSLTLIRSTIGGMVLDVPVKEGNSVIEANNFNDGTTIASIADMEDLIFLGKVDESEVEKLSLGMDLILTIGAIQSKKYEAKLEYIAPKGVAENGAIQFEIKAAVRLDKADFIRAGYSANADIVLDRKDSVLTISETLVQYDDEQKAFVEVATGENTYERRDVKLGLSDGLRVEVLGGIVADDKIKMWSQPIYE